MRNPDYRPAAEGAPEVRPPGAEEADRDITRDTKGFTVAIRTRIFTFLRAFANGEFEAALTAIQPTTPVVVDNSPVPSTAVEPADPLESGEAPPTPASLGAAPGAG